MNKVLLLLICFYFTITGYAQNNISIETDIFGNIIETRNGIKSKLEKNIFGDLVFTDTNQNQIIYKKDFLNKVFQVSPDDKRFQKELFTTLSFFLQDQSNFKETYEVTIFNKVVISSNQGEKFSIDLDMVSNEDRYFWANKYRSTNTQFVERNDYLLHRDSFNNLLFEDRNIWAKLSFLRYGEVEYKDSFNHKVRYNQQAWKHIIDVYQSEETFFISLLNLYINN